MSTITTRAAKGSALTFVEMDSNLTNLNTDKLEKTNNTDIGFAATGGTPAERNLSWNDTDGTLDIGLKGGNVSLQVGQEQVVRVLNTTGSSLTDGQVVRVTGVSGQRLTVALAQADSDANSANTLAIVTEPISNNQQGFATTFGLIRNINTSSFAEGAILYLSPTVAGGITTTVPVAPQHAVVLGWCVRSHATVGQIYVSIQNGYELNELHDVKITSLANGQLVKWNSSLGVWENFTPTYADKSVANTWTAVQTPATGTATVSATGTFTFNPSEHGQECVITCTNATTITLAISAGTLVAGTVYRLVFVAGDTSARTLAKGATVLAPGAALPYTSLATTIGSRDHLVLFAKNTNTAEVVGAAQDVR